MQTWETWGGLAPGMPMGPKTQQEYIPTPVKDYAATAHNESAEAASDRFLKEYWGLTDVDRQKRSGAAGLNELDSSGKQYSTQQTDELRKYGLLLPASLVYLRERGLGPDGFVSRADLGQARDQATDGSMDKTFLAEIERYMIENNIESFDAAELQAAIHMVNQEFMRDDIKNALEAAKVLSTSNHGLLEKIDLTWGVRDGQISNRDIQEYLSLRRSSSMSNLGPIDFETERTLTWLKDNWRNAAVKTLQNPYGYIDPNSLSGGSARLKFPTSPET